MSRPDVLDAKTSRILPPAAGADCPRVDLLQAQSAISERCAHLDAQLPSLMAGLQRTLGGLFNGLECRLELSPFELCVITSYSIHYTKLYESRAMPLRRPRTG